MKTLPRQLLATVSATGRQLQPAHALKLAAEMAPLPGPGNRGNLLAVVPAPGFSAAIAPLLDVWEVYPGVSGALLGAALSAASQAHDDARVSPSVEVVVSGPSTPSLHARRTEQVLCQLIAEARQELLLMTYSLSMYDELRVALKEAIARGVRVTVVSEDRADNKHFTGDPAAALAGLSVTRLRWPSAKRGKPWASMHAKIVVVDRVTAFITSANLSETAANDSIEAGILIRGGDIPSRFVEHVERLRAAEELRSS